MKGTLKRCLQSGQKVEIIYISKDEKITQRIISIRELNGDYVIGYCHYRRKNRKFKIENILSAAPVRQKSYTA